MGGRPGFGWLGREFAVCRRFCDGVRVSAGVGARWIALLHFGPDRLVESLRGARWKRRSDFRGQGGDRRGTVAVRIFTLRISLERPDCMHRGQGWLRARGGDQSAFERYSSVALFRIWQPSLRWRSYLVLRSGLGNESG